MKCRDVKSNLSAYIDEELDSKYAQQINLHLSVCLKCQTELNKQNEAWTLLREWKDVDPEPNYIARFWTELSFYTTWQDKLFNFGKWITQPKIFLPVIGTCLVFIFAGLMFLQNTQLEERLANLDNDQIEFAQEMELVTDMEVIQIMDFLNDLDVLESVDLKGG